MDREELIRKYAGGEKDLTGGDFIRSHWIDDTARGGIYQEADFSNSYFDSSGFHDCNLSFSKFTRVRMYESSFEEK
jgi:uncharacterized protein YjbI with pentapeptide repeats